MQVPFLQRYRFPSWLLHSGMVLGVLAYCIVLGMTTRPGRDIGTFVLVLVPAGVVAAMFASQYFQTAVLLLPPMALAVSYSIATGTASRVPLSLGLALLLTMIWCASMYLRGWKLVPSPLNWPLLVFGAICIISLIWGIAWRDPVLVEWSNFIVTQVGALVTFLMSLGAALLIGNFVRTTGQLKYILAVFLLFLSMMVFRRMFDLPLNFLNDGGLWGTWLITILYGLILTQPGLHWLARFGLVVLLLMALKITVIDGSGWLSGWIPSIAAIFVVTFLHSRRLFFVLLIVGALTYQTAPVREFFFAVNEANVAEGSLSRLDIWERNSRLIGEHWLFGTGPAGYAIYNVTYFSEDARSSHSNYFDIAAQFGLMGLLSWLWLSVVAMWEGWRLIQRAPPGFLRTLAIIATGGWVGALVAMVFGDWVLPFAYNVGIAGYRFTVFTWIFLGTLISIRQLLDAPSEMALSEVRP